MKPLRTILCLPAILLLGVGGCKDIYAVIGPGHDESGRRICPTVGWSSGSWDNCVGTYTFANGDKYAGEWKDDKKHGQGTYTFASGRVWKGFWSNDDFVSGEKYAAGEAPSGEGPPAPEPSPPSPAAAPPTPDAAGEGWSLPPCPGNYDMSNWTNCVGTRTYPNGDKYDGEWKYNNMHGEGTYTSADGAKYVGEWEDDNKHGYGTYTFADGREYSGGWKNGKWHGQGTATHPSGGEYSGGWKDGKMHGEGTIIHPDGRVEKGIWRENELLEFLE